MKNTLTRKWVWASFGCLGLSLVLVPVLQRLPANTPLQTLAGLWLTLVCLGSSLFSLWLGTKMVARVGYRLAGCLSLVSNVSLLALVSNYVFTRLFIPWRG